MTVVLSGPVRVATASIAAGVLAGSVVLSLLWITTPGAYWFVMLTAVLPYALPGHLVALTGFLMLRRRAEHGPRRWYAGAAVIAAAGVVLHAMLLAPAYLGNHPHGDPDLTVMTLNVRMGRADPAEAVALVRRNRVDVLILEEVSPTERNRLRAAGLDGLLPNVGGSEADGSSGTMIFSAYSLTDQERLASRNGAYRIRVQAPEPFWLVAVHTSQPLNLPAEWAKDWRAVNAAVGDLAGDVVVAGDFNATLDHRPVRDLLSGGFADAARQANAGWQPTWPGLPGGVGLIAIDHVVFSERFDAIRTSTEDVAGTDHRALIAELTW